MDLVLEGMEKLGRPLVSAQRWKQWMEEAGFEDVTQTIYRWPTNCWPRDPHYKELGTWSLANIDAGLEAFCLAPLTRGLGLTKEEALVLVAKARKDLRNPKIHAYWPIHIVYGRKPLASQEPSNPPPPAPAGSPAPGEAAADPTE